MSAPGTSWPNAALALLFAAIFVGAWVTVRIAERRDIRRTRRETGAAIEEARRG